jgi:hypothetical protein
MITHLKIKEKMPFSSDPPVGAADRLPTRRALTSDGA